MGVAAFITLGMTAALFGLIGARTILALVLMALPFYLLLRSFSLSHAERLCYGFAIGITIIPSLSYWLGFLMPFSVALGVSIGGCLAISLGVCFFVEHLGKG